MASLDQILEIAIGVTAGGLGYKYLPDLADRWSKKLEKWAKEKYVFLKKELILFITEIKRSTKVRLLKRVEKKRIKKLFVELLDDEFRR